MTSAETAALLDGGTDWRRQLPATRRRHLRTWLWSGAALTFLILVIGGITRLTQSGLSIVDWDPIMGIIPPLNEAEWQEAFARYREFPEYQQLRRGMTLGEFQFIFFWEYLHRLIARALGIAFLIPFLYFQLRGYFSPALRRRVLVLFALGALQGFVGWFMVSSGLVDRPSVSHFRLAIHLTIALAIIGYCVWLIRELAPDRASPIHAAGTGDRWVTRWVQGLGALLGLQIVWGAFVAGLDAGLYYNTFPLMGGRLIPPAGFTMEPLVRNLVENPVAVQWVHRVLGTGLLLAAVAFVPLARRRRIEPVLFHLGIAFCALTLLQYGLGVTTLLLFVPVSLGVVHQATAVFLLCVWIVWLHEALHRDPSARGTAGASRRVHIRS